MAERKSGPVKPPVIDLTARPVEPEPEVLARQETTDEIQPEPAPAEPGADTPSAEATPGPTAEPPRPNPPLPPRPPARLAMPWSAISIAAAGGALLGTALTYALVNFVPLADHRPVFADPAARLDAQDNHLTDLEARLGALEQQAKRTQVGLDATVTQLDTGLNEVRQSIAALPAVPPPVDLAPVEERLQTLESRVTALGAGASSADATALAQTIAGLEEGLADLRTRLDAANTRVDTADTELKQVQQQLTEAKGAIAAQNTQLGGTTIAPAIRLPLVVSGLESAFANGRPYAGELKSLQTLLPDLEVPSAVSAAADTGLPRPDAVSAHFARRVPEILAGGAATPSGDLGQDALAWMKGVLALRPSQEIEGSAPEAVMSRLENAVARGDFSSAAALLDQLPAPMQNAAADTATDIRSLAAAEAFTDSLRAKALAPVAEAAQ